jgi:hypothetical protein
MTRIAITGHRGLPATTAALVDRAIRADLAARDPSDEVVGVTCLADGADQIFARAVVDLGGSLEVIIPAAQYRDGLPPDCWPEYDDLLARARHVYRLPHVESDSASHMDASNHMLLIADHLVAVWDGQPARGYGGTADVVAEARARGLPVTIIWPNGASRD